MSLLDRFFIVNNGDIDFYVLGKKVGLIPPRKIKFRMRLYKSKE